MSRSPPRDRPPSPGHSTEDPRIAVVRRGASSSRACYLVLLSVSRILSRCARLSTFRVKTLVCAEFLEEAVDQSGVQPCEGEEKGEIGREKERRSVVVEQHREVAEKILQIFRGKCKSARVVTRMNAMYDARARYTFGGAPFGGRVSPFPERRAITTCWPWKSATTRDGRCCDRRVESRGLLVYLLAVVIA